MPVASVGEPVKLECRVKDGAGVLIVCYCRFYALSFSRHTDAGLITAAYHHVIVFPCRQISRYWPWHMRKSVQKQIAYLH